MLTFPTESELSLHKTSWQSSSELFSGVLRDCIYTISTAALVNQVFMPRTTKAMCIQKRLIFSRSVLSATSTPAVHKNCPRDLKLRFVSPKARFRVWPCLFLKRPTFYHLVSSSCLFWTPTSGDKHIFNSSVWFGGRTGQQYPNVLNTAVSSLNTSTQNH